MSTVSQLPPADQEQVQPIAQKAADRLKWFGFLPPTESHPLTIEQRLEVIRALYFLSPFRQYVTKFISDDERVTAFEDAVVQTVFNLIGKVPHV